MEDNRQRRFFQRAGIGDLKDNGKLPKLQMQYCNDEFTVFVKISSCQYFYPMGCNICYETIYIFLLFFSFLNEKFSYPTCFLQLHTTCIENVQISIFKICHYEVPTSGHDSKDST